MVQDAKSPVESNIENIRAMVEAVRILNIENIMRFLILACKIFEREISKILGDGQGHSIIMLEFGYHKMPVILQQRIQEIINNASDVDAVLLLYGYCGGTLKLNTRDLPVIMPRAHDCFDIMLGSNERFLSFQTSPEHIFFRK